MSKEKSLKEAIAQILDNEVWDIGDRHAKITVKGLTALTFLCKDIPELDVDLKTPTVDPLTGEDL